MRLSPTTPEEKAQSEILKSAWLRDVEALLEEVKNWASSHQDWEVIEGEKSIAEEAIGNSYQAPFLQIIAQNGRRLILDPVALFVIGAQGRVDLYEWPTLSRIMLLRNWQNDSTAATWTIRTDSGVNWPYAWSRDTFVDLAQRLLNAS